MTVQQHLEADEEKKGKIELQMDKLGEAQHCKP